jgi:glycosyltransferase involved in cell wall biosynthesis
MHNNITFVIFTYNEENRIERVIRNFKNYGKILIADNKSTDRTQEIALSHGCEILIREKQYIFVENQEMVSLIYEKVTTDWIYWGFADEMLDKITLIKIKEAVESGKYDIISMDRKNYFYGEFCYDIYNGYNFKIFKKNAIDFIGNHIHGLGKPIVSGERIFKMPEKYFVHHFISNTASSYLNVINKYTEAELESKFKVKKSKLNFLLIVVYYYLKNIFFSRGYKAGFNGLALTELMLTYAVIRNMKHYEKQNLLSTLAIEKKNNLIRDQLLKQFNTDFNY